MINRFLMWIEKVLMPPMAKASEQKHLRAIRDGVISTLPLIIIGSFFLIIAFPPITALADLVKPYTANILIPFRLTLGLMSLYAAYGMGHSLAKSYKLDGQSGGLLSLATFLMMTIPVNVDALLPKDQPLGFVLPMGDLGGSGLFVAIISMIFAVEMLRLIKHYNWTIKMPEQVPASVARSFDSLIPAAFIIVIAWVVRVLLNVDLHKVVNAIFSPLGHFAGNTLIGAIIPVFFVMILWAAGVHGMAVMGSIFQPIWFTLLTQNQDAAAAGHMLPNTVVEPFFQWFVWIGGAGASLGLALLMVFSRSKYLKQVGRFSIIPGLFNINEPLIFGTPLVMNPILAIPFILIPVVLTIITYGVFALGWIAKISVIPPWTLPAPIGAFFATQGDWRAIVLALVNIAISVVLYYPFFKMYEKKMLEQESAQTSNDGHNENQQATV